MVDVYSTSRLSPREPGRVIAARLRWLVLLLCVAGTCNSGISQAWGQHAPESPAVPWQPRNLVRNDIAAVPSHEIQMDGTQIYSLGQLIDVAESNNPRTRAAWERAKVSAAAVGIAKSELYPTITATATGRTFLNPPLLYQSFVLQDIGLFETALNLNYTLIDFGARRTEITAAQARLLAANLNFNYQHLVLIQQVSQYYYALLNATGLRDAAEVSLNDAKALEDAAEDRKKNGLATLPDVLEARAATATANYDLQSSLGAEQTAFGNLATALTATPIHPFKVEQLGDLHIPEALDQSVEDAIQLAFQQRPDLLADVARVGAGKAEIRHAYTAYFPKIEFEGERGWLRAYGKQENYPGTYGKTFTYDARLSLRWTLFDGWKRESQIAQARAEERAAEQEVHEREDTVADHVWSDYANVVTALQQRKAATSLLSATTESYSAAQESYKDGVRNILDVLSAERELAHARAVDVTARTQVLQAFTTLSFRTGDLLSQHPKGTHP